MRCTVLMPMGGLGSRFADAGYTTPKPLIEVDGKPMFLRATESFPESWDLDSVFVVRKEHEERFGLARMIAEASPEARIALLDHDTRGPVETCLEARELVNPEIPIVVADCDIRFRSIAYVSMAESGDYDGILASFRSRDPRYSYAEVGEDGFVCRTAEKVPISEHALLGGYWFRSGGRFFSLADEFMKMGLPDGLAEYYLSHLFNIALSDGDRIGLADVDGYDIWGTPEELDAYVAASRNGGES
ncbi:MAG: glycosyltransferase family 2 protein [Atopobiaceae bacterium]|nr:glycosyltransferase family 2 protein [Atopobiaceae bacterium]